MAVPATTAAPAAPAEYHDSKRRDGERGERRGERGERANAANAANAKRKENPGESNGAIITEHTWSILECAFSWHAERRHRALAGWARFCHRKKNEQKFTSSNQPRTPPNAQMERHCHEMLLSSLLNQIGARIVQHGHHGDRRCAVAPGHRRRRGCARRAAARCGCCWLLAALAAGCWLARGCALQEAAGIW